MYDVLPNNFVGGALAPLFPRLCFIVFRLLQIMWAIGAYIATILSPVILTKIIVFSRNECISFSCNNAIPIQT